MCVPLRGLAHGLSLCPPDSLLVLALALIELILCYHCSYVVSNTNARHCLLSTASELAPLAAAHVGSQRPLCLRLLLLQRAQLDLEQAHLEAGAHLCRSERVSKCAISRQLSPIHACQTPHLLQRDALRPSGLLICVVPEAYEIRLVGERHHSLAARARPVKRRTPGVRHGREHTPLPSLPHLSSLGTGNRKRKMLLTRLPRGVEKPCRGTWTRECVTRQQQPRLAGNGDAPRR